ncbi:MAG: pyridoxal phosphate-dependent aminotransferase [Edaphobacter sp.]|uniref:pyridoxal phosphate-dependent aminotransferase n=1 Tax=Edaphobacter sp. TaxID=1934404 RepID=UPI00238AEC1E|nr:pyridoxal phosphate-dependent aminotransferase [Edaphobacter sp.]MDE1177203.1 pyridoxal phosphate-dependent aminotransferase [Edaphobacter sp.]
MSQLSNDSAACSGFSRRSFLRTASASLVAAPILTEAHFARAAMMDAAAGVPEFTMKGVYIDANENPLGPSENARKAIADIIPNGGRYAMPVYIGVMKLFAEQMGVPMDHVMIYDGSSAPLHFTTLAFTSPSRSFVCGNPTYEAGQRAADVNGAKIHAVPLSKDYSHDTEAMVKADPNAGLIYICNPNNPTGTITSKAQIDYAVANKPAGAVVLVDEAYIHLSDATSAIDHVKAGKDVVILRTFSKIYGMAGIRCGFAIGRPDLLKKLETYGQSPMPITGMIAAQASLMDASLVPTRKKLIADTRNKTFAWLKANNYDFVPSESNCFMIDVKRPGKEIRALMAKDQVYIGRSWAAWPNHVRVTVGLPSEMETFQASFKKAMSTSASAFNERPFVRRDEDGLYV